MGEKTFIIKCMKQILNHYIVPINNFQIFQSSKNFKFIFDDKFKLALKKFSYEENIERVGADDYSTFDHGQLKIKYDWGIRFDCSQKDFNTYIEHISLLMLAFRIFEHADCSFEYILNVTEPHLSKKNIDRWKRSIQNEKHSAIFTADSLYKIKEGYKLLGNFRSVSARTRQSIQFLYLSYISYYWMQALMLFMTSIETLVSPDIKSEKITSIIINRILKLVPDKSICSKTQLNKIYELRSDIVHVKIITDIELKKELHKLVRLQKLILFAFNNILKEDFRTIYRDNIKFEKFFN